MKKALLLGAAAMLIASAAQAERIVMVTHTQGTDPFWPVVEKGARDVAKALGVQFEYKFAPSGDMADMANPIEAAVATKPDGLVVSLPDPAGLEQSRAVGAILHVGQPERLAGKAAGERAKKEGAKKALCLDQEAFNTALVERCEGYFGALGQKLDMIDVSNDVARIRTRTAAALQADPSIGALSATGPHVCEAAAAAVKSVGAEVHLACFDLSQGLVKLIKEGQIAYTIDQQQRLQGCLPIVFLHLYNTGGAPARRRHPLGAGLRRRQERRQGPGAGRRRSLSRPPGGDRAPPVASRAAPRLEEHPHGRPAQPFGTPERGRPARGRRPARRPLASARGRCLRGRGGGDRSDRRREQRPSVRRARTSRTISRPSPSSGSSRSAPHSR
jgi:simple sugar transport system substrate-binding protein